MDEIRIVTVPARVVAGVRRVVRMDGLPKVFDATFHEVGAAIQQAGASYAGPPYARYFGMPTDTVDVEIGMPVDRVFDPVGDVVAQAIPEQQAVEAVHVGPYDTLEATYGLVMAWIGEHGVATGESMWEIYESDPSQQPDPSTWRTRILFPLA